MRKALTLAKTSRKSSRVTVLRLPEYTHEVWSRKNKNIKLQKCSWTAISTPELSEYCHSRQLLTKYIATTKTRKEQISTKIVFQIPHFFPDNVKITPTPNVQRRCNVFLLESCTNLFCNLFCNCECSQETFHESFPSPSRSLNKGDQAKDCLPLS